MALPPKLKNFVLFGDGFSYQGQIPEVKLPKLAIPPPRRRPPPSTSKGTHPPIQTRMNNTPFILLMKQAVI